jgi:DNA-binding protein H-NS
MLFRAAYIVWRNETIPPFGKADFPPVSACCHAKLASPVLRVRLFYSQSSSLVMHEMTGSAMRYILRQSADTQPMSKADICTLLSCIHGAAIYGLSVYVAHPQLKEIPMSEYLQLLEQRKSLDTRIEAAYQAEREPAIAEARKLIADYSLTSSECGFFSAPAVAPKPAKKTRRPAAVKYRGPNGETWTGRGKQPAWFAEAIYKGIDPNLFLVQS